ncbi:MAG: ribbon-helix-helix domain-containing protein [Alphaproteobacteria bacterium]|nr:ribbon-helix-helix domain-containing protein [Alphaproteobacteria bacterium]MBU0796734.1 ribbon-helix-helix domain-containing protein [Alphaproteobacteria bacterium]MBU0889050.1 ribbon-helix-helix domain-containing protein [Alphaproteobacteria bacterium]MBU1814070.1 ribbon-helix-helix domain-containing protein [Alphaproteobacteria bacterium]MBU2091401.1 ribbon-helix-helix domain-containing protein [Alphaproteobacteria bacterium]
MGTSLRSHNVVVNGHRTSMRLEPEMWSALREIAGREKMSINQLCGLINKVRDRSSLTSAVRVFILAYFRSVAKQLESPHFVGGRLPLDLALGLTRQQVSMAPRA